MSEVESEFENIHGLYRTKILRYLTRLVGEHEAQDLTQEVFLKVARSLGDFRGESRLSTWIYRIATNAALDTLRSPSFRNMAQGERLDSLMDAGEERNDILTEEKAPSAEQQLIRKEMNGCIRGFIENLPGNYRAVLVLSELEELKNEEVAEVLGITLDTVKIRLHRARKALKKELEAHCNFSRDDRDQLACDQKAALDRYRKKN